MKLNACPSHVSHHTAADDTRVFLRARDVLCSITTFAATDGHSDDSKAERLARKEKKKPESEFRCDQVEITAENDSSPLRGDMNICYNNNGSFSVVMASFKTLTSQPQNQTFRCLPNFFQR